MSISLVQYLLGSVSGLFVGFVLGLVGGGGSILAVPLIVYVVGVSDPGIWRSAQAPLPSPPMPPST